MLDVSTILVLAGVLIPTLIAVWWIATISLMHRREVYFWRLSPSYVVPIIGFVCLLLCGLAAGVHPDNMSYNPLVLASAIVLWATIQLWALIVNTMQTKSVLLALSLLALQNLAFLAVFFIWLVFHRQGYQANEQ